MKNKDSQESKESQWLPISDLMSVLMMVFLLIAISYMIKVSREKNQIKKIAVTYNKLQKSLYKNLEKEFAKDLQKWDAVISETNLSVEFRSPELLFQVGSENLTEKFKEVLKSFFPRFIRILYRKKYRNEIDEIRIEGHTSSEWSTQISEEDAYLSNMALSQDRTRQVLSFALRQEQEYKLKKFIRKNVTANGLSSSQLKFFKGSKIEDKTGSRRVVFRVKTKAEERIAEILQ